jgi:hypothetical protein
MSTNKDYHQSFIHTIFPETRSWIEFGIEDEKPLETKLKTHGKWIFYGSDQSVKKFASLLKNEIGEEIDCIKYSLKPVQVTPNSPKDKNALVVYCYESDRSKVLTKLKNMGIKEVIWKYDWESFQEFIDDPNSFLKAEILNPGKLEYLAESLGLEIKPEYLKMVENYRNCVAKTAEKFGELAEMYEKGVDEKIIQQKLKEYFPNTRIGE